MSKVEQALYELRRLAGEQEDGEEFQRLVDLAEAARAEAGSDITKALTHNSIAPHLAELERLDTEQPDDLHGYYKLALFSDLSGRILAPDDGIVRSFADLNSALEKLRAL